MTWFSHCGTTLSLAGPTWQGKHEVTDLLTLPYMNSGKSHARMVRQMPREWPTFITEWTHLSLRTLCLFGVTPVMGKTENTFQRKPNLLKEKCMCLFNNLFVYYSMDRMMEQTISSQATFLRHLSADNWSWNTSVWNAWEEGLHCIHCNRLGQRWMFAHLC